MEKQYLLQVLSNEIQKTVGCTDPVAVSLAVATAVSSLGEFPEIINIDVSPNIYKNGISVGVPGIEKRGLVAAARLGALLSDFHDCKLDILDNVTPDIISAMKTIPENMVTVSYQEDTPDSLYIKAVVYSNGNSAWAVIQGDYAHIIEKGCGTDVYHMPVLQKESGSVKRLLKYSIKEIINTVIETDYNDFRFLCDSAEINKQTATDGLESGNAVLGTALRKMYKPESLDFPQSSIQLAKIYTASAAEARMKGMKVPIMAIAGSGNHGITNFLGIKALAETLGVSDERYAKALGISSIITVYIKGHAGRMTGFCGCAVAPAVGIAAATVYLLGGSYGEMVQAMNSVVGALAGIVCDGAKESCAYKLSTAAAAAIELGYLAVKMHASVPFGMGIVGNRIEDTIRNLGKLNNPGMIETDKCILGIIEEIQNIE